MDSSSGSGGRVSRGVLLAVIVVLVVAVAGGVVAADRDSEDSTIAKRVATGNVARPLSMGVDDLVGMCRSAIDLDSIPSDGPLRAGPAPRPFHEDTGDGYRTTFHWEDGDHVVELTMPAIQRIDIMGPTEELDEAFVFQEAGTVLWAETALGDPRCDRYELTVLPDEPGRSRQIEIDPVARDLGLEVVRSLRFVEPRPETCGDVQPGLSLREEGDVPDAAAAFVRDTLGLPAVMKADSPPGGGATLTSERCTLTVGVEDDSERDVLVGLTGGPGRYAITSVDLATWASDADGSAPDLGLAVDGDELVVELDWWCDGCAAAFASLDFGAPDGRDDAELRVVATVNAPPVSFRMRLPGERGEGPGALLVHVVGHDGRLLGVRSAVVDREQLQASGATAPDCGQLGSPPFAGGATPADAALRFARNSDVTWSTARVVDEDLTSAPCRVMLEGEGGEPRVTVQLMGSKGRYGVVGAHGAVATDEGEGGVLRVGARSGVITVDDPYWCPGCGYRLTTLTYEGVSPVLLEGSDGGSAPRQLGVGETTPNHPGLLLVTTYATERLVEVTALTLPPGDFSTRSFCVRQTPRCPG